MNPRRVSRRRFSLVAGFALALGGWAASAAAAVQDEPGAVESFGEQVTVDVVNVEAWVLDRKGRPVTGLSAADFELLVDGEPAPILYFSAYSDAAAPGDGGMVLEAGAPVRVSDENLLRVVVFVDDWNLQPEDRARVLDDLRDFLDRELRPGEQVMVVVHNGSSIAIAQELTADRAELAGSLDRLERRASPGIALASERRQTLREIERSYRAVEEASQNPLLNLEPCVDGWPDMENAFRSYAAGVAGHAGASASALASAIRPLAGLPGTKVLIYVGNGLPDQPAIDVVEYLRQLCPHRQTEINNFLWSYDLNSLYDQVIEEANANRVTLFMMEAEKPGTWIDPGTTEARFRLPSHAVALRDSSLESGLVRMADETGGRAVLDAADFAPALADVSRDLRHYYSFGFAPRDTAEGEDHRIEVRLREKQGYRVRHRSAYRDKPFELRMMERVYAVSGLANESNPLGVRVETGEGSAGGEGRMNVPIRIWTPLAAITLVPTEEGSEGRLRLMMAVTEESEATGPIRQKMVPVKVGSAAVEQAGGPPREKLVEISLSLPPGRHRIAIGLRDELGGETTYLRHDVEVAPVAVAAQRP